MILVTGATGFIGGAIVRALVERGEGVRALVRSSSRTSDLAALGVGRAVGDVLEPSTLEGAMVGIGAVIHCAGELGRAGASDAALVGIHAGGTRNILRASRVAKVERIVHISSPGLLGPIQGPDADEDAPVRPTNPYERAKATAEAEVHAFEAEHGASVVVVRPEFVYGPGDHHVLRLFQAIQRRRFFFIGSGRALCHPTYVDDAVAGVVAALDRAPLGRTYHIAGPLPVTIEELIGTFARAMGLRPPRLRVPERAMRLAVRALGRITSRLPIDEHGIDFFTFDRHFSCARANRELGYVAKASLEHGARQTVAWYRERRLLPQ